MQKPSGYTVNRRDEYLGVPQSYLLARSCLLGDPHRAVQLPGPSEHRTLQQIPLTTHP